MGKKVILTVSALTSLTLIGSVAYNAYAEGTPFVGDSEKDAVILPSEIEEPKQREPEQESPAPETPPEQPDLPPE